ncbi:MAG: nitrous oxide-stimulated promoter family protein [Candidatus Aminicenantes bacterium]|nr:nitrous oxide-stimulated promoter family protein [Candidatus Aminicenantes bacterium]
MNQKSSESSRIKREKKTLKAMIRIWCHGAHSTRKHLCRDCEELQEYALARLEKCPFGASKGACSECPVHCYKPDMRKKIRTVMRYSGPRMLLPHPWLSLHHLMDKRRKFPPITKNKKSTAPE